MPLAALKRKNKYSDKNTRPAQRQGDLFLEVNMPTRGVRGATIASDNEADAVLDATRELLLAIRDANPSMQTEDLASILFTVSDELDAVYPAQAAHQLEWSGIPLICAREIPVPDGLPNCIRVLIHWNTNLPQSEIRHIYLKAAARLRPDWVKQAQMAKVNVDTQPGEEL
jgi:chorismate mutase